MNRERRWVFAGVREEIEAGISLRELNLEQMKSRGHANWVWDATSLPMGSHYVPIFLELIGALEEAGEIDPTRDCLLETTTGNAGVAAAHLARLLGYSIKIFIPADMPSARIAQIQTELPTDGVSEVILTPPGEYVRGMVRDFRRFLARNRDGVNGLRLYPLNHSRRPEAITAIEQMALAALSQLPHEEVITDAVVALGNGTSASGIALGVRGRNPRARIIGVEPLESPWFFVQKYGADRFEELHGVLPDFHPHRLIGTGGWGVTFPNMRLELLDQVELVSDDQFLGQMAELRQKGISVGPSSSACQSVVQQISRLRSKETNLAFFSMFYDSLDPYRELINGPGRR